MIKKQVLALILSIICIGGMYAQAPQAFKYQGLARNAGGVPLNTQAITVRLSIHDVTSTGTLIYQESHLVTTNSFGLFNVNMGQGTVISGVFAAINWGLNDKYIEQEVDFGSGFVNMGTSQFLSVPYALYSANAPSAAYGPGNGIAITGSVISNTAPDQTVTISPGLNTSVSGTYPTFTVDAIPSLSISGNQLSISNGNTVTLPTAAGSNSYNAGPGISITSGSVINTSPHITPTIAVTTTAAAGSSVTSSGNSFSINVPAPTFTNSGPSTISGAYPNYTINSSTGVTYTNGTAISITSGSIINNTSPHITPTIAVTATAAAGPSVSSTGNSFNINVPSPTFTNAGPATITGAYPNFTINSSSATTYTNGTGIGITSGSVITNTSPGVTPTIAVTATAAAGPSVTSTGSAFNINMPAPTFTNSGPATITGAYPNYTINSSSATTYTNGAGIGITSGSVITNTSPGITPTIAVTNTAAAGSSVTSTGSAFNINVPAPTFTNSGPATITGAYPNYTINSSTPTTYTNGAGISITSGSIITNASPGVTPTIAVTTTAAAGSSVSSTGNTFNINVPAPTFTNSGPATITGAYPNFTINSTSAATPTIAVTSTAATAASISSSGSSFSLNVPQQTLSVASGSIAISGSNGNSVLLPTSNMVLTNTAATGPSLTTSAGSFSLNIPPTTGWSLSGNAGTTPSTNYLGTSDAQPLIFRTNNTARMLLDANGHFAIGTATPGINTGAGRYLTVSSTTAYANSMAAIELEGGSLSTLVPVGRIDFNSAIGSNPSSNIVRVAALRAGNATAGVLAFSTSDAVTLNERMRISEIGNVGLGTTSTTFAKLNIFAATTDTSSPIGLSITNNYTGGSAKSGIDVNVDGAGSNAKFGVSSTVIGLAGDGNANYAFNAAMTPNGSGSVYGNNTTINAAGSGIRYGNYTSVSALAGNNSNIYGHRILLAGTNATALKYGLYVAGEDMNYFSNSVGIGTATPIYKLVVAGPQSNPIDGPNLSFVTSQDNYPTMHIYNINHAEQYLMFNAYHDGAYRSSSTTGNFKMGSYNGKMIFQASGGYAAGTNMNSNFTDAMMIGNNGYVGIGLNSATTQPTYRFHVQSDDAGPLAYIYNTTQSSGTGIQTQVVTTATSTGTRYGLYSMAANGQGVNYGTYSHARGGQQSFGIWTESGGQSTVWNMGIYSAATGTNGVYSGYFIGNMWVGGTLSKSAGTFKIDHPQDPENKYLIHSFVESPDMMNVYNGNTITDANGDATVELPSYFEAENINFRYQLTVMGQFAQAIVAEEVNNNQFKVKTDKPNVKVSWQVTGVRNDAYAKKNRVVPEVDKEEMNRGKYLAPEAFGLDESRRIGPKREDANK